MVGYWVGLTLIWVFNHNAQQTSRFCQIAICPLGRQWNVKIQSQPTQPGNQPPSPPCSVMVCLGVLCRRYREMYLNHLDKISYMYFHFLILQADMPLFQKLGRMELTLREDRIVWPGGLRQKPTGLMIPTHLKAWTPSESVCTIFSRDVSAQGHHRAREALRVRAQARPGDGRRAGRGQLRHLQHGRG